MEDFTFGIILISLFIITGTTTIILDGTVITPKEEIQIQKASDVCESKGGELVKNPFDDYGKEIMCAFRDDPDLLVGKITKYKGLEELE